LYFLRYFLEILHRPPRHHYSHYVVISSGVSVDCNLGYIISKEN
jgi:hypothetical protein